LIPVEVVDFEVAEEESKVPAPVQLPLQSVAFEDPPDYCLYVEYSHPLLQFVLVPRRGPIVNFERTLQAPLQEVMQPVYNKLEEYRVATDPKALEFRRVLRTLSPEQVQTEIRQQCRDLWKTLIPGELKRFYAEQRASFADKSVVVISNEPWIPWELMWPAANDWTDDGPWCETLRLTRWLLPPADEKIAPGAPPNRLRLHRMTTIIPKNDDLPVTERERAFLDQFRKRNGVEQAGVDHPTEANVRAALEHDEFDWVHAATHGNASSKTGGEAPLWLEDGGSIVPTGMAGPEILGRIAQRQPAFVFNACQVGKGSWTAQGLAGWASALVGANAALFVAPLWSVTDDLAEKFIQEFYVRLENGDTVAEAVRRARKAARSADGDPTRLAYSVYAHPNATVTVGDKKERATPPPTRRTMRRPVGRR